MATSGLCCLGGRYGSGVATKVVTFRAELKTAMSDLLSDTGMSCAHTEEAMVALAVSLADYREEGLQLFPRVLVCDNLAEVLRIVQGSAPITIGSGARSAATAAEALKKCAPLASGGWSVWIERSDDRFNYGVFRDPVAPTSIDLRSLLRSLGAGEAHAILLDQVAQGVTEVTAVGLDPVRVHLSGARQNGTDDIDEESMLVAWFVEDVGDDHLKEATRSFATSALHDKLRRAHGTLIAVVGVGAELPDELIADAVTLAEPADLAELVRRHAELGTSESLAELLAYDELLGGMMRCDGIVVLDTAGRVLAFNSFIRTSSDQLGPRELIGGARHRAYAALEGLVADGRIRGVFIRSSNGNEKCFGGGTDA